MPTPTKLAAFSSTLLVMITSVGIVPIASAQVAPHASYGRYTSSNGHAVASFDLASRRIDTFLEHPYRYATASNPTEPSLCFVADESRDLAFDNYFGVRVGLPGNAGVGAWQPDLDFVGAETIAGTGIVRSFSASAGGEFVVQSSFFLPMELDLPAMVQVLRLENTASVPIEVTPYALFNFRLGDAAGSRNPSAADEEASYDATRRAFYEYSNQSAGTIAYVALTDLARGTVTTGPQGVFGSVLAGADLDDNRNTAAPGFDVVPGMQGNTVVLAAGEALEWAVAVVWALDEDAGPAVDRLLAHVGTPATAGDLVTDEMSDWASWHAEAPFAQTGLPAGDEEFWNHAAATLRMGQVREAGAPQGQLLASLPPGQGDPNAQWNISWVRDMAYATAGLSRAGHLDEAWDALAFQLRSGPGQHTAEVGRPYRISITRYFGDGSEESDCNENGPNIEFDGFGLFLWSLAEWQRSGGDIEDIRPHWPVIRDEIADVLISLQQPDGLLRADSSIWEVHTNGQERRFAYSSMAAARGLCDAAALATALGEDVDAIRFATAGGRTRDAITALLVDAQGALGQSVEDVSAGTNYADAATVEAINWGLIDPTGTAANATLDFLLATLAVPSGHGLMRNDDGGDYDSQEWVFVDLRLAAALRAAGRTAEADALLLWVEQQAEANDRQIAELFDRDNADYRGSIPMIGFGPGAWTLAKLDATNAAACGAYAPEPVVADGGVVVPDAGVLDAGPIDAGGVDAGGVDAGGVDAGGVDAGDVDAGDVDAGDVDAGDVDAGDVDAGGVDAGNVDAGVDAGVDDAGFAEDAGSEEDAGFVSLEPAPATPEAEPDAPPTGCGCRSTDDAPGFLAFSLLFAALAWRRRKSRKQ